MTIVDRKFSQQFPDPQGEAIYPKPLCEFFGCDALIVLGDPGAGKTTTFEQAASAEPDAAYVKIRDFLSLNIKRRPQMGFAIYQQIDNLVYKLYGLTECAIAMIEEKA